MSDRPVLFLLCGLPFAGKSTLARAMAGRFGLVHIEIDQVHIERGLVPGRGRAFGENDWLAAFQRSFRRLHVALARGDSVVWDATTFRRLQRDRVRQVAARYGADVHLIYVATPEATARGWREHNRGTRARWDVPEEEFLSVARAFEPPAPDESPIPYVPAGTPDHWLTQTIAPLLAPSLENEQ